MEQIKKMNDTFNSFNEAIEEINNFDNVRDLFRHESKIRSALQLLEVQIAYSAVEAHRLVTLRRDAILRGDIEVPKKEVKVETPKKAPAKKPTAKKAKK